MKANVKKIINVIIDLATWAFSGIRWSKVDKKRQQCPARINGWCKAELCHRCEGMSQEDAEKALNRINQKEKKL